MNPADLPVLARRSGKTRLTYRMIREWVRALKGAEMRVFPSNGVMVAEGDGEGGFRLKAVQYDAGFTEPIVLNPEDGFTYPGYEAIIAAYRRRHPTYKRNWNRPRHRSALTPTERRRRRAKRALGRAFMRALDRTPDSTLRYAEVYGDCADVSLLDGIYKVR